MTDEEIIENARLYANRNSNRLIEKIVGDSACSSVDSAEVPFTIFMAGSPGAGKTEWSKHLIEQFSENAFGVAHIDADDFRSMLPGYTGDNLHLFQWATSTLLANAYRSALKHRKNCIVDTTFSRIGKAKANVGEALNLKRLVEVIYVYQEPVTAWSFVQKREEKEGRRILPEIFAEAFANSPKVVDEIKNQFGGKVVLTVVVKDIVNTSSRSVRLDVDSVGKVVKKRYTKNDILELIEG